MRSPCHFSDGINVAEQQAFQISLSFITCVMYNRLTLASKFLRYFFAASNGKGHGIHSPFVYALVREVLNDQHKYPAYRQISTLKKNLLKDHRILNVADFGGGSVLSDADQRSISEITRYASSGRSFGRLLYRLAKYYQPATMLELGTSMGIAAAYLALGHPAGGLTTIEGSPEISEAAQQNFNALGIENIRCVTGNFDQCLEKTLSHMPPVDLVFVDGNHREEPLLRYVDLLLAHRSSESVFILHDIHWSAQMERAWERIKQHPDVMLTVDLFFGGMIFFNQQFRVKQDFVIRTW